MVPPLEKKKKITKASRDGEAVPKRIEVQPTQFFQVTVSMKNCKDAPCLCGQGEIWRM